MKQILKITDDQNKVVHPIVEQVLNMALQGPDGLVVFPDGTIEQIQNLLKNLKRKSDLSKAIIDLLKLSSVLDDEGSKDASLTLMKAAVSGAEGLNRKERRSLFKDDTFERHKRY